MPDEWSDSPLNIPAKKHHEGDENGTCSSNSKSGHDEIIEHALGGNWVAVRECIGNLGIDFAVELVCRISSANPPQSVMIALKRARPQIFSEQDELGRHPLHYLCEFGAPTYTISFVAQCHEQSLGHRDVKGKTPVDYLMATQWKYCSDTKGEVMKELEQSHNVSFDFGSDAKSVLRVEKSEKSLRIAKQNKTLKDPSSHDGVVAPKMEKKNNDTITSIHEKKVITIAVEMLPSAQRISGHVKEEESSNITCTKNLDNHKNDPSKSEELSEPKQSTRTGNTETVTATSTPTKTTPDVNPATDGDHHHSEDVSTSSCGSASKASTENTSSSVVDVDLEKKSPTTTVKSSNPPPNVPDGGVWGTAKVRSTRKMSSGEKKGRRRFAFLFVPGLGCARDMDAYAIWGKVRKTRLVKGAGTLESFLLFLQTFKI